MNADRVRWYLSNRLSKLALRSGIRQN